MAVHRFVLLLEPSPGSAGRVEVVREGESLARAVAAAVHEIETAGSRVSRVVGGSGRPALQAADLLIRLRGVAPDLSEEDLMALLDLLPI